MDHRYLAQHDGSEQAAGRGSGLNRAMGAEEKSQPKTPYMHMVYGPIERRLDTAIWRALFASSVRQARQFVTHGGVKVNGKKVSFPSIKLDTLKLIWCRLDDLPRIPTQSWRHVPSRP